MSGHSKWATIKRKKGAADAKRGQLFTKLAREIQIAAREGSDVSYNFKLRLIVDKAKAAAMPRENIDRAVRRGAGLDKDAQAFEEVTYEGYGPHGVAYIVETLTDNRNRAVAEVRRAFSRAGGSLGEANSVGWMFETVGHIALSLDRTDGDQLFEDALEAGAEDIEIGDEQADIYTEPSGLKTVQQVLSDKKYTLEEAELMRKPKNLVSLDAKEALVNMNLVEALEEMDDVVHVYTNLDVSDELVAEMEAA